MKVIVVVVADCGEMMEADKIRSAFPAVARDQFATPGGSLNIGTCTSDLTTSTIDFFTD